MLDDTEVNYLCCLDEESKKKAAKELNENDQNRNEALRAFRSWIKDQNHVKCKLNNLFLLSFLRTAKFSQLKARSMLEGYLKNISLHPDRFANIDVADQCFQNALNQNDIIPLPGYDHLGRKVVLHIVRNLDTSGQVTSTQLLRKWWAQILYLNFDERVQINGIVVWLDCTDYKLKHFNVLSLSERKDMQKLWQGNVPTRFKEFHMYNIGMMFDTIFNIVKPFISRKFQDRTKVVNNLEDIYKTNQLTNIPLEYLPDDCNVSDQSQLKSLDELTKLHHSELMKNRQKILDATNSNDFFYDINKIQPSSEMQQRQSYVKLSEK